MQITVKYEVSGEIRWQSDDAVAYEVRRILKGTGLDAANAQLAAENKKLRLKLVDVEVE